MHIIHPSFQSVLLFFADSAQRHEVPEPISYNKAPLAHRSTVLICKNLRPDIARHCPHRPNNTPEPTILHSRSKVEWIVRDAVLSQLSGVISRKEGKFSRGKPRAHNVEWREPLAPIKLEWTALR
jgi:hypothetical protein